MNAAAQWLERQLSCGGCQRGIDGSFSQELRDQVSGIAPDFAVATLTVTLTEAIPVHVPTVTNVTFDGTPFDEAESIPASGSTVDADNWSRTPDDRLVVTYTDEAGGTHVIDKALEDGGGGSGYTGDLRGEMEEKEIPLDAEIELKLILHGGVEGSPDQVFTTQLALAR